MTAQEGSIYKITNPLGKVYIGQSKNWQQRYAKYKRLCCKTQIKLYSSLIKFGFNNHLFEIIQNNIPIDLLKIVEIYQIAVHNSYYNGLNGNHGGGGSIEQSKETRNKMSQSHLGIPMPQEKRIKISLTMKGMNRGTNNPMFGKPAYNNGKPMSRQQKEKVSRSKKGKPWTQARIDAQEKRRK
jgi:group I intron endonuclease